MLQRQNLWHRGFPIAIHSVWHSALRCYVGGRKGKDRKRRRNHVTEDYLKYTNTTGNARYQMEPFVELAVGRPRSRETRQCSHAFRG